MNDSALTLPQLKTELKAEIDRLDVKIDTVKVDLEAKIDTVKTDLEAKIDDRTGQILDTIRETAERIDARQDRRRQAELRTLQHVLLEKAGMMGEELRRDQVRTGAALDEHIRDDSRHLRPAAARGPKPAR